MNTTKPKSRKIAWVVLGVVVLGVGLCAVLAWENWFEVAYVPIGPLIQIGDQREVSFVPFTQLSAGGRRQFRFIGSAGACVIVQVDETQRNRSGRLRC